MPLIILASRRAMASRAAAAFAGAGFHRLRSNLSGQELMKLGFVCSSVCERFHTPRCEDCLRPNVAEGSRLAGYQTSKPPQWLRKSRHAFR